MLFVGAINRISKTIPVKAIAANKGINNLRIKIGFNLSIVDRESIKNYFLRD